MIIHLHGHDRTSHPELFEQMFRLRAAAFGDRRKWRVEVRDGLEVDHFDELDPLYIMVVSEAGRVLASLRLLQTTGPHMLSEVFPETTGGVIIRHPLVWESTRFCVDTKAASETSAFGINAVTGELLTGLFRTALENGLQNIVSVYDLYLERILRRAGCHFERLGDPYAYDGLPTVAGLFDVTREAVESIQARAQIATLAPSPLRAIENVHPYVLTPTVKSAER